MRQLNNISIESNVAPGIDLMPLIGEAAWHSVTLDPTIAEVSDDHFQKLAADLKEYGALRPGIKILEVAAYAHITGYMFAESFDAEVTLFDVSSSTLRLGRDIAEERGLPIRRVRRVAGDFHSLPFETGEFDVVYIASALHHTWRWHHVLDELLRVTRIGGHLILENEPCRRELCLYRFRTNRSDDFTVAEALLDQQGLLRTVAEPYFGSRVEQLFGMTENQEIRLGDMLGLLSQKSEILLIKASPQICMGSLENRIENALLNKANTLEKGCFGKIIHDAFDCALDKMRRLNEISSSLWPEKMHVDALIMMISRLLSNSVYGRGELVFTASRYLSLETLERLAKNLKVLFDKNSKLAIDLDRSVIFGAAIKLIVCKQQEMEVKKKNWGEVISDDGVDLMFDPELLRIMNPSNLLFPKIQNAAIEDIANALGTDWHVAINPDGVRVANPLVARPGVLTTPLHAEHVVVFARVYGVGEERSWTLWLTIDGERRANLVFEKSGSGLLVASVSNGVGPIRIEFEAIGNNDSEVPKFNLAHLGVLRVPEHRQPALIPEAA